VAGDVLGFDDPAAGQKVSFFCAALCHLFFFCIFAVERYERYESQ
jgi:hypothetical protein